jgi:hypothetical protein
MANDYQYLTPLMGVHKECVHWIKPSLAST